MPITRVSLNGVPDTGVTSYAIISNKDRSNIRSLVGLAIMSFQSRGLALML